MHLASVGLHIKTILTRIRWHQSVLDFTYMNRGTIRIHSFINCDFKAEHRESLGTRRSPAVGVRKTFQKKKGFLYNNNHSPQSVHIYSQHQREEATH